MEIPNQLTLVRKIIMDNLGEPDLISWKALKPRLMPPKDKRNSAYGQKLWLIALEVHPACDLPVLAAMDFGFGWPAPTTV